jgi:hypothetical protein
MPSTCIGAVQQASSQARERALALFLEYYNHARTNP